MSQYLRQHVVVEPDGRIVIHVPQLKPGTHAEVTVIEQSESAETGSTTANLASLIGSCPSLFGTPQQADDFLSQERDAWDS